MTLRKLLKLFTFLTLQLLFAIILSGCAFKDIDKRIFVMGIALDTAEQDENIRVTLKLAVPSGALKEKAAEYTYITQEQPTISEAIRLLESEVDKEVDFSHAKVIILGEELIKKNIDEPIDFLSRRRDIQSISYLGVGIPTAEKIIKLHPKSEMAGNVSLVNFFSNISVDSPFIVSTYLFEFRRNYVDRGIDPILPAIKTDEKDKKIIVNKSYAISNPEVNLLLNEEQTLYLNVLNNEVGSILVPVEDEKFYFTMFVDTVESKYKIITKKDSPTIKFDIKLVGSIEESKTNLSSTQLAEYSELVNKEVKKKVENLLFTLQENQLDPIGFGLRYLATNPHSHEIDHYEEWRKMYPNVKFDIHVNANIKSTGIVD